MNKDIRLIIFLVSAILIGVYFSGSLYYKNRFPRNVYVNEIKIGGMTLEKADNKIANSDLWDEIIIKSDKEDFLKIEADEIDYKYVETPELAEIFKIEKEQNWFLSLFDDSVYTTPILYEYKQDRLRDMINGIEELDKELLNARIAYSSDYDEFIIEPHSYEIKITKEEIFDLVEESIKKKDKELNISEYIEQPSIFDDDEGLALGREKANEYLNVELRYDFGDREEVVDRSLIKDWITTNEREVEISPEKVKEYVVEIARKYDTYGRGRQFKTTSGKNITTNGGSYGWVTHRNKTVEELIEHIKVGEDKIIEPVYSFKALRRNSDDIGNSYVEIDLEEQMVYVYIKGQLIVKTETVTGNLSRGFDTPVGVYPLNYKETDATLVGEDYESPVKYWMPFNGNVGLHDASWRDTFGGDIYENKGSNGCVNLPPEYARSIFDLVYPGMPVIVH